MVEGRMRWVMRYLQKKNGKLPDKTRDMERKIDQIQSRSGFVNETDILEFAEVTGASVDALVFGYGPTFRDEGFPECVGPGPAASTTCRPCT